VRVRVVCECACECACACACACVCVCVSHTMDSGSPKMAPSFFRLRLFHCVL